MGAYEKIAKILRADQDTFKDTTMRLEAVTGRKGIVERIAEENEILIRDRLDKLGLGRKVGAKDVYDALISKIEADDHKLFELMGRPAASDRECCDRELTKARAVVNPPLGFFMKLDKAAEFVRREPPRNVMKALGYASVNDLIEKEDIYNIYAALRFVEGSEWLNGTFFKQYESLKPSDFEFREFVSRAMDERWVRLSEGFVKKKYHNLSHLKELGFIFSLPVTLGISGELLRSFTLSLHYYNEVAFYSYLFAMYAEHEPQNFASNIISLLRGDALDKRLPLSEKSQWLVIPRYFAKDDPNDWRLFEPHINPEALHWERAERNLDTLPMDFSFWTDLNWVGDEFPTGAGIDVRVSFNLVDTVMSLVKQKELIKYLYHHEEALWNKIYTSYFSEKEMEEMMRKHIIRGWFEI